LLLLPRGKITRSWRLLARGGMSFSNFSTLLSVAGAAPCGRGAKNCN
jgi:hypothetical protein